MTTTLVYRSEIAASATELSAWHGNPGAFERLSPPWANVRVAAAQGGIAPGDWKQLRVGVGPIGLSWKLVHSAGDVPTGFVDVQEDGPFRSWRHEHRFLGDGPDRSVLEDRITFQLPFNLIAQPLAGRLIEKQLNQLFGFRHRRTQIDLARHAVSRAASPLRIAVSGATGLVGSQLVAFLRSGGHEVFELVRRRPLTGNEIFWNPAIGEIDDAELEGMDAVVHLAGESIAGGRWTAERKAAILKSRVKGTGRLAKSLAGLANPPRVLVSASGVGFYGDAGDSPLTEESAKGSGFLANVCQAWEEAASPAADAGIRVVHARFGVVLAGNGGLLDRVSRAFKLGGGGPLGDGQQFMSWIAIDDVLGVILEAITNESLEGPINAVAPGAVTNREFSKTLAGVLNRPALLRTPAGLLRFAAGELADELLLASQRALPLQLNKSGFNFAFPTIDDALRHELGRYPERSTFTFPRLAPLSLLGVRSAT